LIWHIWWLAIIGLLGTITVSVRHAWRTELEDIVPLATISEHERAREAQVTGA
jgi:cytochrome o ubiquinol oxidase subunit 1